MEQFPCWILAIRRYKTIEMILYVLEMRLTVPKGIVSIEGQHSYVLEIYHRFWQWGQMPLIIMLDEDIVKPSGKRTSGTSA